RRVRFGAASRAARRKAAPRRLGSDRLSMLEILKAADANDDEGSGGDQVGAVSLPQLEQLLTSQLLIDLPGQAVALVRHAAFFSGLRPLRARATCHKIARAAPH